MSSFLPLSRIVRLPPGLGLTWSDYLKQCELALARDIEVYESELEAQDAEILQMREKWWYRLHYLRLQYFGSLSQEEEIPRAARHFFHLIDMLAACKYHLFPTIKHTRELAIEALCRCPVVPATLENRRRADMRLLEGRREAWEVLKELRGHTHFERDLDAAFASHKRAGGVGHNPELLRIIPHYGYEMQSRTLYYSPLAGKGCNSPTKRSDRFHFTVLRDLVDPGVYTVELKCSQGDSLSRLLRRVLYTGARSPAWDPRVATAPVKTARQITLEYYIEQMQCPTVVKCHVRRAPDPQ